MQPRMGVNPAYYQGFRAEHWPEFEQLIDMDWGDIHSDYREEMQQRHAYDATYHPSLNAVARHRWPGQHTLRMSYSQAMQDIFVLAFLDGKTKGTYLELGAWHPWRYNNTYLLSQHGWQGISVDRQPGLDAEWQRDRPQDCFLNTDAFALDYQELLRGYGAHIDYLQLDLDQPRTEIDLLGQLLGMCRFSVINFEHNVYTGDIEKQQLGTALLESRGYVCVAKNIVCKDFATDTWAAFEDWWVDPGAVPLTTIEKFRTIDQSQVWPIELYCEHGALVHIMPEIQQQKNTWSNQ